MSILIKAKQGLIPIKKRTRTGALITFWVKPKVKLSKQEMFDRRIVAMREIEHKANEVFYNYPSSRTEEMLLNPNSKVNKLRHRWDEITEDIRTNYPKMWEAWAEKNGSTTDYVFGDVLA